MISFTTLLVLDREHLEELRWTWPTWAKYRPELLRSPLLIVCDTAAISLFRWNQELAFVDHPQRTLMAWPYGTDFPQRERMLTAFVRAPDQISTAWYLKLDTDLVATGESDWLPDEWTEPDEDGRPPRFVSQRWWSTKPASAITALNLWASRVHGGWTRPELPVNELDGAAKHPRVISWFFLGDTNWTCRMSRLSPYQLPVPSQDTFLWYCAERRGEFFRRLALHKLGWEHIGRDRERLQDAAASALADKRVIQ